MLNRRVPEWIGPVHPGGGPKVNLSPGWTKVNLRIILYENLKKKKLKLFFINPNPAYNYQQIKHRLMLVLSKLTYWLPG